MEFHCPIIGSRKRIDYSCVESFNKKAPPICGRGRDNSVISVHWLSFSHLLSGPTPGVSAYALNLAEAEPFIRPYMYGTEQVQLPADLHNDFLQRQDRPASLRHPVHLARIKATRFRGSNRGANRQGPTYPKNRLGGIPNVVFAAELVTTGNLLGRAEHLGVSGPYFPIQKSRKITSSRSSTSMRPVMRPRARAASRTSSAASSALVLFRSLPRRKRSSAAMQSTSASR